MNDENMIRIMNPKENESKIIDNILIINIYLFIINDAHTCFRTNARKRL